MSSTKVASAPRLPRVKLLAAVALVTVVAVIAVAMLRAGWRADTAPVTVISEQTLTEQYGLHISVLALTAANGMVDLRLKVVDADKAALLLHDPANAPVLVSAGGVTLSTTDEVLHFDELLKDDAALFFMYGNTGNTIQAGAPAAVKFGATQVEPVTVQ